MLAAWASLTLNFFLPRMMPGDPVTAMIGRMHGRLKPGEIEAIRQAYGFTRWPLINQYLQSTWNMHCAAILGSHYPPTRLRFHQSYPPVSCGPFCSGVVTLLISFVLGTILGVVIAWKRNGFLDSTLPGLTGFVGSFPYFWLAMVALFYLGFKLGWFPMSHAYSDFISPGFTWELYWECDEAHGPTCRYDHPGFRRRLDDGNAQHNDFHFK